MLREVSIDEAKQMAMGGHEIFKIYLGANGSRVLSINQALDEIFDETSRFLVDLPEEQPEDQEKPEEEKEEEAKQHKPGRKKRLKLDTGKITALYDAGWSYKKIAEEMGISASTVRKVIVEKDEDDGSERN